MTIAMTLILLLMGAGVGVLSGLLGIGGGLILVPLFSAMFINLALPTDFIFHYALGTSMACIVMTSAFSLMAHQRRGGVLWSYVSLMAPGVVIGAFLGTLVVANLKSGVLMIVFAMFLVVVAWQMLKDKQVQTKADLNRHVHSIELIMVSTLIGGISSLVSIGGGSLTVPYLTFRNTPIPKAIGTSAALGFPLSLAGALGYILNGPSAVWQDQMPITLGYVYWPAVIVVSSMSVLTVRYGAELAHQLPVMIIKRIFAYVLIIIGLRMVWVSI